MKLVNKLVLPVLALSLCASSAFANKTDYSNKIISIKNRISKFGPTIQLQFDQLVDLITEKVIAENPHFSDSEKLAIKEAAILQLTEKLFIADKPLSNVEFGLGIAGFVAVTGLLSYVLYLVDFHL